MKSLPVDSQRLQHHIDALAAISEAPAPVVTRVLFSPADLQGRAFVKNLCQELGLSLREDTVGKTVEWTLTRVYKKLRVRSRTELTAKLAAAQIRGFPRRNGASVGRQTEGERGEKG